jgi:predicted acyl esterase
MERMRLGVTSWSGCCHARRGGADSLVRYRSSVRSRGPLLAALGAVTVSLVAAMLPGVAAGAAVDASVRGAEVVVPGGFAVAGSVEQVSVVGAEPGMRLRLLDGNGDVAARGTADAAGSFLFRDVAPGRGYTVDPGATATTTSPSVRVVAPDDHPDAAFYAGQQLVPGFQYLTTRDGTKLAANVVLPGPVEDGPYPTVVEYSGYDPANPDGNQAASRLAQSLGYATVGVNLRGTGCSGGSWHYFEPLQGLDGYDAVEAVAAQPWVLHGKVGMVGISYPGITQLFVAETRPPHLAAITPLSVIADTYRGVLYPGGILNTGFAVPWAEDRQSDAAPAPDGGQGWAKRRVAAGDTICAANQALRLQTGDVLAEIRADRFYDAARLDPLAPERFVDRIRVPTFLAGAWQDEQTGGQWPAMIDDFAPDVPLRVTMTNGTHSESFSPEVITRWAEFLDFYVARRVPRIPDAVRATAALGYLRVAGTPLELPPDRFAGETDFDAAFARYQTDPPVRVLFDNGAGTPTPGAPVPAFEAGHDHWPVREATATDYYFGPDGSLTTAKPRRARGGDDYRYDPEAMPATSHPSSDDDYFSALPDYEWKPVPDGLAASYVTAPLANDTVVLGPASADVWLASNARDVDLEVVITEVRPDGLETYVQSGWLRASHRELDGARSTRLEPVPTYTKADRTPLPRDGFVEVRVPVFPVGHAFRAGSRIRVVVQAPGGNRPQWAFRDLPADGDVTNTIARTAARPSRIVLPVVEGATITTPLPPCPALRGQPCRDYVEPKGTA